MKRLRNEASCGAEPHGLELKAKGPVVVIIAILISTIAIIVIIGTIKMVISSFGCRIFSLGFRVSG